MTSTLTFRIDYKNITTELCKLGRKYDTDKSSERDNVGGLRHAHAYTPFYDSLFEGRKNDNLHIAELGIAHGASMFMWNDYFPNSQIYGFDHCPVALENFKNQNKSERIHTSYMNVKDVSSLHVGLQKGNVLYDVIIDDTTHDFEDQIRIVENAHTYLKPGGILIVEDIFKSWDQENYINRLKPVLDEFFQDYYFVEVKHNNLYSGDWFNDKLLILVKKGEPIFRKNKKLTLITPSIRPENLSAIQKTLNFDYIDEWIIVYDGKKITENPCVFKNENNKIKEYLYEGEGICGNPQRNYGLSKITNEDTFLYFLDDDNTVHPDLYKLLNFAHGDKMYSFNQEGRLKGDNLYVGSVDTAMMVIDYKLCKHLFWHNNANEADGFYINQCWTASKNNYIYVDNDLCFYNKFGDFRLAYAYIFE
jgi:predicted O-methyltransferase YrrM